MNQNAFRAPYLPYDKIRLIAENFLGKFHPEGTIPVTIENIIEFKLNIDIVPLPGLQIRIDIEGFISSDLKRIYVDQNVMEKYPHRYRFTLAHEIGHSLLHKKLYQKATFDNVSDWKHFISCIDPREYSFFELHAYDFAGLILVPTLELRKRFSNAIDLYQSEGFDPRELDENEMAIAYISTWLAKKFNVSSHVIKKRLKREGLIK